MQGVSYAVFVENFCLPSLDLLDSLFSRLPAINWNARDHLKTLEAFE